MRRFLLSCLLLFAASIQSTQVDAFAGEPTKSIPAYRHAFRGPSFVPSVYAYAASKRFALIYGENGQAVDSETDFLETKEHPWSPLKESLASQLDLGMLTRVACAFAPPPHAPLHPKHVQSATLVSVDPSKQLEVALAIPQDNTADSGVCVQILVPIVFPMPCVAEDGANSTSVEQRIRQTLHRMDEQAKELLLAQEIQQDQYEQKAAKTAILQQLEEEPYAVTLPDWWTFPELKITLAEECSSLKQLLNEDDFARDLRVLCQVHAKSEKAVSKILTARIASVGPSGLYLRAYASLIVPEDVDDDEAERFATLDVPIAFPQTTTSADDLRKSVLDLVESVESVPEQKMATAPTEQMESIDSNVDESTPAVVAEVPPVESREESVTESSTEQPASALEKEKEPSSSSSSSVASIAEARKQPKSPEEEARLAAKYAAMDDIGERAYAILKDLGMF